MAITTVTSIKELRISFITDGGLRRQQKEGEREEEEGMKVDLYNMGNRIS